MRWPNAQVYSPPRFPWEQRFPRARRGLDGNGSCMKQTLAGGGTKLPTSGSVVGPVCEMGLSVGCNEKSCQPRGKSMSVTDIAGMNSLYSQLSSADDSVRNSLAAKVAAKKYMADNDADGDGVLSQTETGLSDDSFTNVDADGGGTVDSDELQTSLSASGSTLYDYIAAKTPAVKYELVSQFLDARK